MRFVELYPPWWLWESGLLEACFTVVERSLFPKKGTLDSRFREHDRLEDSATKHVPSSEQGWRRLQLPKKTLDPSPTSLIGDPVLFVGDDRQGQELFPPSPQPSPTSWGEGEVQTGDILYI